jgi:uncharacterized membrane protein YuzA (DUF378 family)
MLKPVIGVAAVGLVGILLLPLLVKVLGVAFFFIKIALVIGLVWLMFRLFRKSTDKPSGDEAHAD